jgi:hypothetical protein
MYALGITLFELTFGCHPYTFSGNGVEERLKAHRECAPRFPDPWPDSVPRLWRNVLARLLAKWPQNRYADYPSLLAALRRLQPAPAPAAGRMIRALAWLVDLALVTAGMVFARAPFDFLGYFLGPRWSFTLATVVAQALVALSASYLQAVWRTSAGKKLFQIRVVDRHGLTPSRAMLAARMVAQIMPAWLSIGIGLAEAIGWSPLSWGIVALACGGVLFDAGWSVMHAGGQSLHDRLFGTRVVLDTRLASDRR